MFSVLYRTHFAVLHMMGCKITNNFAAHQIFLLFFVLNRCIYSIYVLFFTIGCYHQQLSTCLFHTNALNLPSAGLGSCTDVLQGNLHIALAGKRGHVGCRIEEGPTQAGRPVRQCELCPVRAVGRCQYKCLLLSCVIPVRLNFGEINIDSLS